MSAVHRAVDKAVRDNYGGDYDGLVSGNPGLVIEAAKPFIEKNYLSRLIERAQPDANYLIEVHFIHEGEEPYVCDLAGWLQVNGNLECEN